MKRNFLIFSVLFFIGSFVSISSLQAKEGGQGIAYYNAGFEQVAKPLLIAELVTDTQNKAITCFYLGNIYFGENKADSAAIYFNKGLVSDPLNALNSVGLSMLKIKKEPVVADLELQTIFKVKTNKNNADLLIAAANAYLANDLVEKASFYHEKAKKIKPKYALVSVLLGDIELAKKNIGIACSNYEMAIYYDATCKEAYIKYARAYRNVNTPLSIEKLGLLKEKDPSFLLVDKELADIYYANNEYDKAAQFYENYLHSGNSTAQDLTKYAMTLFLNKDFAKSLEIANQGLKKDSRSPAFNRLAMYNNTDLKQYDAAIKAADLLFNNTNKSDFNYLDYLYFGVALQKTKQFDLAIPQFKNALKKDSSKVELWKEISDMYNEKADYNNAIETYNTYISTLAADKITGDVLMPLGKTYNNLANNASTPADLKKSSLLKADSIFAQVAVLEPMNYRGNYWRARVNTLLDPETTDGLAKPYYELTATLLESKPDAARFNQIIIECYSYLGYFYYVKKDYPQSLSYWDKVLAIDAQNKTAITARDGIVKAMKGK